MATRLGMVGAARQTVSEQVCRLAGRIPGVWEDLRGASLFITGGTGFVGRWLLETLADADTRYDLGLRMAILTREPANFASAYPCLVTHPGMDFVQGDVRNFVFPRRTFTHILHAAAVTASATFNRADPLTQFDIAYQGTRRVLEFAAYAGVQRFLMTSSGSVYGPPTPGMARIPEDYTGAPLPNMLSGAPEHGKRAAEFLCEYYREKHGIETVIGRCFTFVGPGLPLDIHYAIGNFIGDALWGESITVKGDGSPVRSYMYVADLIVWLLTMLCKAPAGSLFNVGSDAPISIMDLAELVRSMLCPEKPIRILGRHQGSPNRNFYVPDISHARRSLQLDIWTSLDEAIRMTAEHARPQHLKP